MIESISAVTLGTHDMRRTVRFYRSLGFDILHGGEASSFTSFRAGMGYLNLIARPDEQRWSWWGRIIFYVADVDALYNRALAAGCQPAAPDLGSGQADALSQHAPHVQGDLADERRVLDPLRRGGMHHARGCRRVPGHRSEAAQLARASACCARS